MAEIKVGDKVRLTQDVSYSNHKKGDVGVVTRITGGLTSMIRVHMEYNNTSGDTAPFTPDEIELVEDVKVFKVGDYFTNTDKDIVWKVTGFPSRDEVKTKALMVTDGLDFAETVTLSREVVLSLDGATPEQIEAFENHPYWDKQEPVADAISPSVYQFPNGVEVRDISAHLTSFGGQAVQYIARSTRLDGVVKGLPVQDLKKAIQLLEWEVERLEA